MSTNPNQIPAAAEAPPTTGTTDPTPTPTPTVTFYQKLADDFSKALDEITAIIPKLEITHPATANFVRSHLNVPTEFLATAIATPGRNFSILSEAITSATRLTAATSCATR